MENQVWTIQSEPTETAMEGYWTKKWSFRQVFVSINNAIMSKFAMAIEVLRWNLLER